MSNGSVAVLFARRDSVYKTLSGCDVFDADRDARTWPGGTPVIAHPPCRAWGRLRHFAAPAEGERELAIWACKQVRMWGGVLEHPAGSLLWHVFGLPYPGDRDEYGGYTLPVLQYWWGHRAQKATWLYIVGCEVEELPELPLVLGEPTHVIQSRKRLGSRPHVSKAEREQTPVQFAKWLVDLAQRTKR